MRMIPDTIPGTQPTPPTGTPGGTDLGNTKFFKARPLLPAPSEALANQRFSVWNETFSQLPGSSRTADSGSQLVLGALYMLGARSRAKIERFKMHIRPKVRTF